MPYGIVSAPWWDEAFLVGGGPSLRGFDFDRLRGKTVVAINDAAKHLPWATALFSLDQKWITSRRNLMLSFPGEKYLAANEEITSNPVPGAIYLRRVRENGLSDDPGAICLGGTSGYGAVNLAYLKRSKRIVLLGYDFYQDEAGKHWHSGYEWVEGKDVRYFDRWARLFGTMTPQLAKAGVNVLNASPMSRVEAFSKVSLEELW